MFCQIVLDPNSKMSFCCFFTCSRASENFDCYRYPIMSKKFFLHFWRLHLNFFSFFSLFKSQNWRKSFFPPPYCTLIFYYYGGEEKSLWTATKSGSRIRPLDLKTRVFNVLHLCSTVGVSPAGLGWMSEILLKLELLEGYCSLLSTPVTSGSQLFSLSYLILLLDFLLKLASTDLNNSYFMYSTMSAIFNSGNFYNFIRRH